MSNLTPPGKLLPQFDCTTCLECCRRVVLTISEVKPFLAGQLCQVTFQKSSSLTIGAAMALAYLHISIGSTESSLRHTAISTKTKCDGSYV